MYEFYLGLDAEPGRSDAPDVVLSLIEKAQRDGEEATYRMHRLQRFEGGLEAGDLVETVQNLLAQEPYVGRTILVINESDDSLGLYDALSDAGLSALGVSITGDVAPGEARACLKRLDRSGRLDLQASQNDDASELAHRLQGAAEDPRDGLLRSPGLAVWLAEQHSFDPTEHFPEEPLHQE